MSRKLLIILLLVAGLALLGGCAVNPVTGRQELALTSVSPQQEIELGKQAFPQVLQKMGGTFQDPELEAYVNQVGQRLGRVSHRPELHFEFKVLNDSAPNAFALPGGFIAISRGLLVGMRNEAELAAVLGHEIGHVTARHSVQGMQRGSLLSAGLAVLAGATGQSSYGPLAQRAGELAAGLINNSYSREQESEADRLGIDYMVRAGYNPLGSVQLQEYFYKQVEKGANHSWLTGLFRTHPFSRDRMLANRQYADSHYPRQMQSSDYLLAPEPFLKATAKLRELEPGYALYDQARQQERKGDTNGAIATYLQAAAKAPDRPLILTGLGMAYLRAEDQLSARRYLEQAVKLDDGYFQSQLGLGYIYLQRKEPVKAQPHLQKSLDLLPTGQAAYLLAEVHEQQGEKTKALELYQAVAEADPGGQLGKAAAARAAALKVLP